MNELGKNRVPFFFIIDFEENFPVVQPLASLGDDVAFRFKSVCFEPPDLLNSLPPPFIFEKFPMPISRYEEGFNTVMQHLKRGNSFLTNLTYPTRILTNHTLENLYCISSAPYKLLMKDRFVVFSPESFVRIEKGKIYSTPMKGTIDAAIPDAEKIIMENVKETAEHHTIIDLIRNDLSRVSKNVRVTRYRFIDEIVTHEKKILQVSSEISGDLPPDYHSMIGNILWSLLPAGSISGAPKHKTLEIIREAEGVERGYYTGIAGVFDGNSLDSAVLIRFIEEKNGFLYQRSGCGITHLSQMAEEYQEMIDKVYVPINRKYKIGERQGHEHSQPQPKI